MKIVISPYSRKLRNGSQNAKDYPYWPILIDMLINQGHEVIQIGAGNERKFKNVTSHVFDLKIKELEKMILAADLWISVDNFLPHLMAPSKKRGIVLFSKSDPEIFGYKHNINLLKDPSYLRQFQFDIWEVEEFDPAAFVSPSEVMKHIS